MPPRKIWSWKLTPTALVVPPKYVLVPKSTYKYSSFADQFGVNFFSRPAPTVQPTRVLLSDNAASTTVNGALCGTVPVEPGPNNWAVLVVWVANFTSPTARPPVPYSNKLGSARKPARPLNVANHGNFHSL